MVIRTGDLCTKVRHLSTKPPCRKRDETQIKGTKGVKHDYIVLRIILGSVTSATPLIDICVPILYYHASHRLMLSMLLPNLPLGRYKSAYFPLNTCKC